MNSLSVTLLSARDAEALSKLLESGGESYSKYFHPFSFDAGSLEKILSGLKKDKFWGIYIDNALIGLFMLRGLDAGFPIPSYGVYVAKEYSCKGLSSLTLHFITAWCKLNSIEKVMIKVHPENYTAKRIYEKSGAVPAGIDPKNANLIYYLSVG